MPDTQKTTYLEAAYLNHTLRGTAYTPPSTLWLALFTADPGEAGSLASEVSGGTYTRQQITFGAPAGSPRACANTNELVWAQATGSWGAISHVMVMDAETGGNGLYYGPTNATKSIDVDDVYQIPVGELTVTEK